MCHNLHSPCALLRFVLATVITMVFGFTNYSVLLFSPTLYHASAIHELPAILDSFSDLALSFSFTLAPIWTLPFHWQISWVLIV